jgi:hypothetical protein
MRGALLAQVAPQWLCEQITPEWGQRYSTRFTDFRLPKESNARVALAETIGVDGAQLLKAVYACTSLPWLPELPAIETLRRVWW